MAVRKMFCEFFAGIGLVREALRTSGWECVYSNDIDLKKKKIYGSQFGKSDHYHLEDVRKTDEVIKRIEGHPFLATATFPCTDLSLAGSWVGIDGPESSTYFSFLKVLAMLGERKPPLIMLENVTGFLTANKGRDFPRAMKELASLGYWIDAVIVDARYFVPQSRPRLFVVGIHENLSSPLFVREGQSIFDSSQYREALYASRELHPKNLIRIMESTELSTGWFTLNLRPPTQTIYNLFDIVDLDDDQEWWNEQQTQKHYHMMHDYHRAKIDDHIKRKIPFLGTVYRRTRQGVVRAEVRFDGIAGCLRTTKGGSARQIICAVINGQLQMRWMSPREYARLQGVGDYCLNNNNPNETMFSFGDAVCVPVIRWLDQNILTPIYNSVTSMGWQRDMDELRSPASCGECGYSFTATKAPPPK